MTLCQQSFTLIVKVLPIIQNRLKTPRLIIFKHSLRAQLECKLIYYWAIALMNLVNVCGRWKDFCYNLLRVI